MGEVKSVKVEDLRIGNIIWDKSGKHIIVISGWLINDMQNTDFNYSGIEITPRVLEACGFSIDEECNEYQYCEGCEITLRNLRGNYYSVYEIRMDGFKYLQYLHELQNLFYCLSGMELVINLEGL